MLLAEMVLPLLSMAALVPVERIALIGRFDPADVIKLAVMVLPSLPVVVPVLKKIVPVVTAVPEPAMVQFLTVLLLASLIKRSVLVPAATEALKLEMVRKLPLALKPSMMTLLAPLRLMSGAATVPDTVLGPTGLTVRLVQAPLFKLLVPSSVVTSAVIVMRIVLPA